MRYEVMDWKSAEEARKAGAELQRWSTTDRAFVDCKYDLQPHYLYRIKPAPSTRRVPLPDLRVLAGSMLVWPNGDMVGIEAIRNCGNSIRLFNGMTLTAQHLMDQGAHCQWHGCPARPCWTEEEVEV
jgi:hypothetical protein